MPQRGFGVKVELKVDKNKKKFNDDIKNQIDKIDLGDKLTVSQASLKNLANNIKNAVAPAVSTAVSDSVKKMSIQIEEVKIKKFNATSAIDNVRKELEKMFRALSLKNGVDATGLNNFIQNPSNSQQDKRDAIQRNKYVSAMKTQLSQMDSNMKKYLPGESLELDDSSLANYRQELDGLRKVCDDVANGFVKMDDAQFDKWRRDADATMQWAKTVAEAAVESKKIAEEASKTVSNTVDTGAKVAGDDAKRVFKSAWNSFRKNMSQDEIDKFVGEYSAKSNGGYTTMEGLYDSVIGDADTANIAAIADDMNNRLRERTSAINDLEKAERTLAKSREKLANSSDGLNRALSEEDKRASDAHAIVVAGFEDDRGSYSTEEIRAMANESERLNKVFGDQTKEATRFKTATEKLTQSLNKLKEMNKAIDNGYNKRFKHNDDGTVSQLETSEAEIKELNAAQKKYETLQKKADEAVAKLDETSKVSHSKKYVDKLTEDVNKAQAEAAQAEQEYNALLAQHRTLEESNKALVSEASAMLKDGAKHSAEALTAKQQQIDAQISLNNAVKSGYALEKDRTALAGQYQRILDSNSRLRGTDLETEIGNTVRNLNDMNKAMSKNDLNTYRARLNNIKVEMNELGLSGKRLGEVIADAYKRFGGWAIVTKTLSAALRVFRQMITSVVSLDTAMTELYKVTDETSAAYEKFFDNAADRAKKYGATLTDTVTASADFARLGYSLEDAANLADTAIVYKAVGDGIDSISTASESIISTMQAFKIEASDAMKIVDKFNITGRHNCPSYIVIHS